MKSFNKVLLCLPVILMLSVSAYAGGDKVSADAEPQAAQRPSDSVAMLALSLERLSSGLRMNRAADDAAWLYIKESEWQADLKRAKEARIAAIRTSEANARILEEERLEDRLDRIEQMLKRRNVNSREFAYYADELDAIRNKLTK